MSFEKSGGLAGQYYFQPTGSPFYLSEYTTNPGVETQWGWFPSEPSGPGGSDYFGLGLRTLDRSQSYGSGPLDDHPTWVQTSAVPVPAAVWLFGSALAGLGWLRRGQ